MVCHLNWVWGRYTLGCELSSIPFWCDSHMLENTVGYRSIQGCIMNSNAHPDATISIPAWNNPWHFVNPIYLIIWKENIIKMLLTLFLIDSPLQQIVLLPKNNRALSYVIFCTKLRFNLVPKKYLCMTLLYSLI